MLASTKRRNALAYAPGAILGVGVATDYGQETAVTEQASQMTPQHVPEATFHTRQRIETPDGTATFDWKPLTTADVFGGQRVVLLAVPGAYTPACSDAHLPGYERLYEDFRAEGVDRIACLAVNDAFVMNHWAQSLKIEKVQMLPDGNGDFTRQMGMLVDRTMVGMGHRSWRYAMLVEVRAITTFLPEPGFEEKPKAVPFGASSAENLLAKVTGG